MEAPISAPVSISNQWSSAATTQQQAPWSRNLDKPPFQPSIVAHTGIATGAAGSSSGVFEMRLGETNPSADGHQHSHHKQLIFPSQQQPPMQHLLHPHHNPSLQQHSHLPQPPRAGSPDRYSNKSKHSYNQTPLPINTQAIVLTNESRKGNPLEIEILKSLKHKNIVDLQAMVSFSEGPNNVSMYMVFEYMDHDITGVLQHVRANLLLNNYGELKLKADFGLARRIYIDRDSGEPVSDLLYKSVVTLWYRPPELLLGRHHMGLRLIFGGWGCIFVEFFSKTAIFQGRSEIEQMDAIIRICGSPTVDIWPGVKNLSWHGLMQFSKTARTIEQAMRKFNMSVMAIKLIDNLLTLDPSKRLTAKNVLAHPYFQTEAPPPCDARQLPRIEGDWHEFEGKQRKSRPAQSTHSAQFWHNAQSAHDAVTTDAIRLDCRRLLPSMMQRSTTMHRIHQRIQPLLSHQKNPPTDLHLNSTAPPARSGSLYSGQPLVTNKTALQSDEGSSNPAVPPMGLWHTNTAVDPGSENTGTSALMVPRADGVSGPSYSRHTASFKPVLSSGKPPFQSSSNDGRRPPVSGYKFGVVRSRGNDMSRGREHNRSSVQQRRGAASPPVHYHRPSDNRSQNLQRSHDYNHPDVRRGPDYNQKGAGKRPYGWNRTTMDRDRDDAKDRSHCNPTSAIKSDHIPKSPSSLHPTAISGHASNSATDAVSNIEHDLLNAPTLDDNTEQSIESDLAIDRVANVVGDGEIILANKESASTLVLIQTELRHGRLFLLLLKAIRLYPVGKANYPLLVRTLLMKLVLPDRRLFRYKASSKSPLGESFAEVTLYTKAASEHPMADVLDKGSSQSHLVTGEREHSLDQGTAFSVDSTVVEDSKDMSPLARLH
ncbi:hypothetical protein BSLG_001693 [Batrachochytrium salamandrivorans]|nr:hypothetical protein BSLG_001693 [Batrachochytrium salamandrivorans]